MRGLEMASKLIATLDDLAVTPTSLRVEWQHTDHGRPMVSVWCRTRSDFEAVTEALRLKTKSAASLGHRRYWTTADHPAPLIQCASFPHHEDYDTPTIPAGTTDHEQQETT